MHKVQSTAVGKVVRCKLITPEGGKPFAALTLELCPRAWNGKTFTQRVDVRSYREPEGLLQTVKPGDLVSVSGETEAETFDHNGKTYGRLVITGNINKVAVLSVSAPDEARK